MSRGNLATVIRPKNLRAPYKSQYCRKCENVDNSSGIKYFVERSEKYFERNNIYTTRSQGNADKCRLHCPRNLHCENTYENERISFLFVRVLILISILCRLYIGDVKNPTKECVLILVSRIVLRECTTISVFFSIGRQYHTDQFV